MCASVFKNKQAQKRQVTIFSVCHGQGTRVLHVMAAVQSLASKSRMHVGAFAQ